MNGHHDPHAVQWFFTGFFALLALVWYWRPPVDTPSCARHMLQPSDEAQSRRLERALSKRRQLEEVAGTIRMLPAVASLALALVTALGALPGPLGYGVMCLFVAVSAAAAYLKIRNNLPVRVAVLAPRTATSVIPAFWLVLAGIQGLLALDAFAIDNLGIRLAAAFVCASSLLCAWLAWRVTEMPAVLAGDDVPMEQLVDLRLRFQRAAGTLLYAFAPSCVFLSFARTGSWTVPASFIVAAAFVAWFVTRALRKDKVVFS